MLLSLGLPLASGPAASLPVETRLELLPLSKRILPLSLMAMKVLLAICTSRWPSSPL